MKILRGYIWCRVKAVRAEERWLNDAMSTTYSYYTGTRWRTGIRRFYSMRHHRFAAGLLSVVLEKCKKGRVQVDVIDVRSEPEILPLPAEIDYLFYFQKEAIEAVFEKTCGILKHPTASGKTLVAMSIAARVKGNTLFLVDEKSLREDALARWRKVTGTPPGMIVGGNFDPRRFTAATLQGIYYRLRDGSLATRTYLQTVRCLIVDECHVLGARTYFKTVMSIPAYYRIGLSATPTGRSDKKDSYVVGAIGPVIHSVSLKELVKFGRLAQSDVVFFRFPGGHDISHLSGWHRVYQKGIVLDEARCRSIIRLCKVVKKPVIVFVERRYHGRVLRDMISEAGFATQFVWQKTNAKARLKARDDLNSGKLEVLVCSKVFNKGINIPGVRTGINAAGMKGIIPTLQKAGRTMRVDEATGKHDFMFIDFVDDHHPTLLKHSRKRWNQYKKAGMLVRIAETLREVVEREPPISEPVQQEPSVVAIAPPPRPRRSHVHRRSITAAPYLFPAV